MSKRLLAYGPPPLHLVKKDDGFWKPCGDYSHPNKITEPVHQPLPIMVDATSNLHCSHTFSKLNFLKGYFQFPIYPDNVPKMIIITPFGTCTFNYSCFGLRN